MSSLPLPDPSGAQHCPHCGQLVTDGSEFCPHCGASLRSENVEGISAVKVVLLSLGTIFFGGLGACLTTASGIAGGTGSALADILAGSPGYVIALLFAYAIFKEVTTRGRR